MLLAVDTFVTMLPRWYLGLQMVIWRPGCMFVHAVVATVDYPANTVIN